jgi:uncharacterized protein (TIGR02300 family)
MVKPELGAKRVCVSCGTRFYDLLKAPAVCPKCNTEQPAEQPRVRRSPSSTMEDKRPKKIVPEVDDVDADVDVPTDDVDEDVLADAEDLEEDDVDAALGDDLDVAPPGEEDR